MVLLQEALQERMVLSHEEVYYTSAWFPILLFFLCVPQAYSECIAYSLGFTVYTKQFYSRTRDAISASCASRIRNEIAIMWSTISLYVHIQVVLSALLNLNKYFCYDMHQQACWSHIYTVVVSCACSCELQKIVCIIIQPIEQITIYNFCWNGPQTSGIVSLNSMTHLLLKNLTLGIISCSHWV